MHFIKVTIHDVAREAGVSVATVSRYLNKSNLIAPASIEKVRSAIEKLNYRPNMMARGLVKRNTDTIALVVDYSHEEIYGDEFFLMIQVGIERALSRFGYYLLVVNIPSNQDAMGLLGKIIMEERVDGIILLKEMASFSVIKLLHEMNMSFVVIGRGEYTNSDWVDIDNVMAGYVASKKLIEGGAKRIGFITNGLDKRFANERFIGYRQALQEFSLPDEALLVIEQSRVYSDLQEYLKECEEICDAYVATDSSIAYYFIKALKKRGIKVPEQVKIVAFDNQLLAKISEPGITVVDIDVLVLGEHAARNLIENLKNAERQNQGTKHELLGVKIIERESSK